MNVSIERKHSIIKSTIETMKTLVEQTKTRLEELKENEHGKRAELTVATAMLEVVIETLQQLLESPTSLNLTEIGQSLSIASVKFQQAGYPADGIHLAALIPVIYLIQ